MQEAPGACVAPGETSSAHGGAHLQVRTPLRTGQERVKLRCEFVAIRMLPLALHIDMCRLQRMPTNLAIDDALLGEAQKVGGHRTKKDTVNEALREYIQRRRQAKVVELFGKIDFDSSYDYKKQRRRS